MYVKLRTDWISNFALTFNAVAIAIYKPADVRPILQAYQGKDIPVEYAKKEAAAKQQHLEEWEQSHKGAVSGFTLSGLFGGSSVSMDFPPKGFILAFS